MKKISHLLLFILCFSWFSSLFACDKAPDTSDPGFCSAFKSIAKCHCEFYIRPEEKDKCLDMAYIYRMMNAAYGSQSAACRWQASAGKPERATYQECMDDWNCYQFGGVNSKGGLCNATGNACR